MAFDWPTMTKQQIQNVIDNYRHAGNTQDPIFLDALEALEKQGACHFEFQKSVDIILSAAKKGRCIGYKDLADAHGVDWSRAHYAMNGHLGALMEWGHRKGLGLLSAIVVNGANVASGTMEPSALEGFVNSAKALGIDVGADPNAFLRGEQRKIFDRAKGKDPSDSATTAGGAFRGGLVGWDHAGDGQILIPLGEVIFSDLDIKTLDTPEISCDKTQEQDGVKETK